jgi:hypothetical protein
MMTRLLSCSLLFVLLALAGCGASDDASSSAQPDTTGGEDAATAADTEGPDGAGVDMTPPPPLESDNTMSEQKRQMQSYYAPLTVAVQPAIEAYELPLTAADIANHDQVVGALGLGDAAASLYENGFVVVPYGDVEDIAEPYELLKQAGVPLFVTVDTWLHLYHVQFDEILMTLEEEIFYADILAITEAMLASAEALYEASDGLLKEAARRNVAFLRVARELLVIVGEPETASATPIPEYVAQEVADELALIDDHQGFVLSPLFHYKEDYSQYVPRGHYTRSERLKSYFRALMWYGRLTMLLKGAPLYCETDDCDALISEEDADAQTLQALLLSLDIDGLGAGELDVMTRWERIYLVTAFFVGFADDLSVYEYLDSLAEVLGEAPALASLVDEEVLFAIRASLAKKRAPQIYSGTGGQVIMVEPGEEITPDMLNKVLDKTKGFRFMGQRFIPDSFMMGRLVSPGAGALATDGDPSAFTSVLTPVGYVRGFPRGLDVMATLGSDRARELLTEYGDDAYTTYDDSFAEMKAFVDAQSPEDWHANLYWGWLYTLRSLLTAPGEGAQTFMQTTPWQDKSLTTALASWAELRHDTILYAKQSYTPEFGTTSEGPPPPPPPQGYVEPNPAFYARLLTLNEMTRAGLDDMDVLPDEARQRLEALSGLLQRMLDLSVAELQGEALSEADLWFIDDLAESLETVVTGVDDLGIKTTMVADVHTDGNTKKVLEEGVGYVQLLVAAYRVPDGRVMLGAGPVMSYYEFKHPMSDRLTDEAWRELLKDPALRPAAPPWTESYGVF